MKKFVFIYRGGKIPTDPAEIQQAMQAWGNWMQSMGSAVIDGGNPVGKSTTVNRDGSVTPNGGSNPIGGYSLIAAKDREDAITKAQKCPILAEGGNIELAEVIEMG